MDLRDLQVSALKMKEKFQKDAKTKIENNTKLAEQSRKIMADLDSVTSMVVAGGGTVSADDRRTLSMVNPLLQERMAGRGGHALQVQIHKAFDPLNVLHRDEMFPTSKYRNMTWLERMRQENKQVNFILNKFGKGI